MRFDKQNFFRNFNPIRRVRVASRENLSNRSSGVQIPSDICTRFGRYLYHTKCSWIIIITRSLLKSGVRTLLLYLWVLWNGLTYAKDMLLSYLNEK